MQRVFKEISKLVIGKSEPVILSLVCLLAKGHILIEDVPGVGKTLLASSLAKTCNVEFSRIQCTSDLLPGDIIGFHMFDINTGDAKYIQGPVMTNLLLVDEINRTSPKTQSALLEVMEENKVSIDGKVFKVPSPFMVVATQNSVEFSGTFPLPEAQLDRFMMKISMGYPSEKSEISMLHRYKNSEALPQINAVLSSDDILRIQQRVEQVEVSSAIAEYIVKIVTATRNHKEISLGCSPRASISLMRASQALAFINERDYIIPDDVKNLAEHVLAHRIILTSKLHGLAHTEYSKDLINHIVDNIDIK